MVHLLHRLYGVDAPEAKDIPLLLGFLSSLFSVAHCLDPAPRSYDLVALYKYVYCCCCYYLKV